MVNPACTTPPSAVQRVMRKHGLPEPTARLIAALAYGEAAMHEPDSAKVRT